MMNHVKISGLAEVDKAVRRLSGNRVAAGIRKAWRRDGKTRLQPYIRRKMKHRLGGTGKLAKSYTIGVSGRAIEDTKLQVYSRVPATEPHEFGGMITPKKGKYLSIPTKNAKTNIGYVRFQGNLLFTRKRLTPRILIKASEKPGGPKVFTKRKNGKLIMFQVLDDNNLKLKRYFRKNKSGYHLQRVMPMFIFVRSVYLRPRTNIRGIMDREVPKLAEIAIDSVVNLWEGKKNG